MTTEHADFTFPATTTYRAMHGAVKTRRLPDGKFQAVGAFWFLGARQALRYFEGETRAKAKAAAYKWLHS